MLTQDIITTAVRAALVEDAPWGDITSEATIPADAQLHTALTLSLIHISEPTRLL